jgi:hypothetical protein
MQQSSQPHPNTPSHANMGCACNSMQLPHPSAPLAHKCVGGTCKHDKLAPTPAPNTPSHANVGCACNSAWPPHPSAPLACKPSAHKHGVCMQRRPPVGSACNKLAATPTPTPPCTQMQGVPYLWVWCQNGCGCDRCGCSVTRVQTLVTAR